MGCKDVFEVRRAGRERYTDFRYSIPVYIFYESEKSQRTPEFRVNKEKNTAECISRAKEHYDLVRHYWQKVPLADRASCARKAGELVKLIREDSVEAHPYVYIDLAGCLSSAFCKGKPLPCAD